MFVVKEGLTRCEKGGEKVVVVVVQDLWWKGGGKDLWKKGREVGVRFGGIIDIYIVNRSVQSSSEDNGEVCSSVQAVVVPSNGSMAENQSVQM